MRRDSRGNALLILLVVGSLGAVVLTGINMTSGQLTRSGRIQQSQLIAENGVTNSLEALSNLLNNYGFYQRPEWDGSIAWHDKSKNFMDVTTGFTADGPKGLGVYTYNTPSDRVLAEQQLNLFGQTPLPAFLGPDPAKSKLTTAMTFLEVHNEFPPPSGLSAAPNPPDGRYFIEIRGTNEIEATIRREKRGTYLNARIEMPPPLPYCEMECPGTIPCEDIQKLTYKTVQSDKSLRLLASNDRIGTRDVSSMAGLNLKGGNYDFRPYSWGTAPVVQSNIIGDYCGSFHYAPPYCASFDAKGNCTLMMPEVYTPGAPRTTTLVLEATGYGVTPPWDQHNKATCKVDVTVQPPAYAPYSPPAAVSSCSSPGCPQKGEIHGAPFPFDQPVVQATLFPGCLGLIAGKVLSCCPSGSKNQFVYEVYCGVQPPHVRDCNMGCFDPHTEVLMGDRSVREAKDVVEGDFVWNPMLDRPSEVRKRLLSPEALPMVELRLADRRLRVTTTHPMLTPGGFVRAEELEPGSLVLADDGEFRRLLSVARPERDPAQMVVNFQLGPEGSSNYDEHHLVADGVVTGDYILQVTLGYRLVEMPFFRVGLRWPKPSPVISRKSAPTANDRFH